MVTHRFAVLPSGIPPDDRVQGRGTLEGFDEMYQGSKYERTNVGGKEIEE